MQANCDRVIQWGHRSLFCLHINLYKTIGWDSQPAETNAQVASPLGIVRPVFVHPMPLPILDYPYTASIQLDEFPYSVILYGNLCTLNRVPCSTPREDYIVRRLKLPFTFPLEWSPILPFIGTCTRRIWFTAVLRMRPWHFEVMGV